MYVFYEKTKYLVVFCIYVCENLAPLPQHKVFMEEISFFVSICWLLSRARTLHFESET